MAATILDLLSWVLLTVGGFFVIVGGIGRPYGAIAGGLIIGIATEMSTAIILPVYKPAVAFGLMVLVLIFRPRGIFAEARTWNR